MKFKKIASMFLLMAFISMTNLEYIYAANKSHNRISDVNFQKLSIENGLSSSHITKIFQDSRGYMWLGTLDGLNRYDGNNIKTFSHDIEDDKSLSSINILSLAEDLYGNIWVGTDNGLNILLRKDDKIIRLEKLTNEKNIKSGRSITDIFRDSDDNMWVGTDNGLNKINIKTKSITKFYKEMDDINSLGSNYVTAITELDRYILAGTKLGITAIDKYTGEAISRNRERDERFYIYDVDVDKDKNLWISTKEGVIKKGYPYEHLDEYLPIDIGEVIRTDIKSIMVDSENNVWMSSANGAIAYSEKNNSNKLFKSKIDDGKSISSNFVNCFFQDRNGIIWIGTDDGVSILNNLNQFNILNNNLGIESVDELGKLSGSVTWMFEDSDGEFWFGTKSKGVYRLNDNDNKDFNYRYDPLDNNSINSNNIKTIIELRPGTIIVSTDKGLNVIDKNTKKIDRYYIDNDYIIEINAMIKDENNIIWQATTEGIISFDLNTGKNKLYNTEFEKQNIEINNINTLHQDKEDANIIWIGGGASTGLIKFHKNKGVLKHYETEKNNKGSLTYNDITVIQEDNKGNIWIGTSVGLNKFDKNNEKFTRYTVKDGLSNNYIKGLLIDNNDNPWMSTNGGVCKFDITSEQFIKFTEVDGLQGMQYNKGSYYKGKKGYMFFGGINGITYFNPDNISDPKHKKENVVIGEVLINGKKFNYDGKDLVLKYNENNISFEYFLPNYKSLNSIDYRYKLEGIDSSWQHSKSNNFSNYTTLEPGNYKFKVIARDAYGKDSEETVVNIKIKQPIWKTPIAYFIYLVILIIIAFYIWNYVKILEKLVEQKTMNLNKQLEENEKLSNELINQEKYKNDYFVNLSHELRTPINVILSTAQLIDTLKSEDNILIEKLKGYMDITKRSCDNLLKIIRDIIDSSKIESGSYKIEKQNIDIVYVVEEAALNMSKFIESRGLSFVIDPEIEEQIVYCDPIEIERCVINLLGNAVKFTPEGGEIKLFIKENEDYIDIIVEDNGIGISKEDQEAIFNRFSQAQDNGATKASSSGIGLTLVKHIADLHNGKVTLESEVNKGSKFTISIPMNISTNKN